MSILRPADGTIGNMRDPKLAEHYRKLATDEVAMAKLALTNESRARHYAKAAEYWNLADAEQDRSSEFG